MRKFTATAALTGLCLVAFAAAARAQTTINVPLSSMYSSNGFGAGGGAPFWRLSITGDPDPAPYIGHVEDIQPASYFEYRVTCTTPGLYSFKIVCFQPSDPGLVFMFESRPYTPNDDPTVTRFATQDSKDYGQFGSFHSDGTPRDYQALDPVVAADGTTPLTVPLVQGDNIIRIRNITNRHVAPTAGYPLVGADLGRTDLRPGPSLSRWSNLHVAEITLNRVADLPAMGTITGTLTGTQPAGQKVASALVLANPPGQSPPEIASWWVWGYYTFSRADGTYTLNAPLGSRDVKAGRPSSYLPTGSPVSTVTVPATGSVTADLTLPSIWYKDNAGDWTAFPQAEYLDSKDSNLALIPAPGENNYRMGWSWAPKKASLIVDVPEAGNYEFTSSFTCGDGAAGNMRLSSSFGPFTEVRQNNVGWENPTTVTAADPIYLAQGTQVLSINMTLTANSDFDGFQLRQLHTPVTVGLVQGTVTNQYTSQPIAGATVTMGSSSVTTDAAGKYRLYASGAGLPVTVSAPYSDGTTHSTVSINTNDNITMDFTVPIRPHIVLDSSAGNVWKLNINSGGTADFSSPTIDESSWITFNVPANWDSISAIDDIYGWYRLHFNVPADFLTTLPNRPVYIRLAGVDDSDVTYLNGTRIGSFGTMPNPPLDVQPANHTNPPDATSPVINWPGFDAGYSGDRTYYINPSLLKATDNVLAVQVFDLTAGGGINGSVTLEVGTAKGSLSGKVLAGATGVAGVRVAASDSTGVSSAWAMTDGSGNFTMPYVTPGATVLSCAKPGYTTAVKSVSVGAGANTAADLSIQTTADPIAPIYDDFNDGPTGWESKWWRLSLENPNPQPPDDAVLPTITEPGVDLNTGLTIPGSIGIATGTSNRGALMSKQRFSRWAAVMAGRAVSALHYPDVGSGIDAQPNVIFQVNGRPDNNDPTQSGFSQYVEIDIESYRQVNGEIRPRWMLWSDSPQYGGNFDTGIVPIPGLNGMDMLSETTPMDFMVVRAGSVFDFYINNTLIRTQNLPNPAMGDTRIVMYSYHRTGQSVWAWVKGTGAVSTTPLAGDVNGNGIVDSNDAALALRMAAGLDASTTASLAAANVAGGDSVVTILDAAKIAKTASGL